MIYPTLYKRSTTGKLSTWYVETKKNCFRTVSGFTDGQKVTSAWTCCSGKSYNTADEQCKKQADALHRKRTETGYFENFKDVDKTVHFKPMLAHDYNDYKDKIKFPVYSQPKLDGMRCIVKEDGMWTRNGKKIISAPHIFDALKAILKRSPGLILDGELYANKDIADFNTIVSCVRKKTPTKDDLKVSAECIKYHVYDLPSVNDTFIKRYQALNKLNLPDCCVIVETNQVDNDKKLKYYYSNYMSEGYEGQIIRTDSRYENKRSKSLLKYKSFIDREFKILGVEEGGGNLIGKVGKLQFEIDGKPFDSAVNGTWEYLEELYKRNDLIGKMATVKYFELTTDGKPRFPKVIEIRDYEG